MKKIIILFVALSLILSFSVIAFAEKFPEKQITIVCQAAAGGGSDTNSRTMAAVVEPILGVPVVVVNKTGAAGAVAMSYVASREPDGYTIGHLPVELSMLEALGYADVNPDNFDLIGTIGYFPASVVVNANSPWENFDEFVEYAKENPGVITVGNSGIGSIWHIAAAKLEKELGVEFTHVPFTGASTAKAALMGGHIACSTASPSENAGPIEAGDLRMLAVMADQRSSLFPDVPTLKELGYDIQTTAWLGFGCPKGLPEDVKNTLVDAFQQGFESEMYQEKMKSYGIELVWMGPDEFYEFAMEEYETYSELIPELGIAE